MKLAKSNLIGALALSLLFSIQPAMSSQSEGPYKIVRVSSTNFQDQQWDYETQVPLIEFNLNDQADTLSGALGMVEKLILSNMPCNWAENLKKLPLISLTIIGALTPEDATTIRHLPSLKFFNWQGYGVSRNIPPVLIQLGCGFFDELEIGGIDGRCTNQCLCAGWEVKSTKLCLGNIEDLAIEFLSKIKSQGLKEVDIKMFAKGEKVQKVSKQLPNIIFRAKNPDIPRSIMQYLNGIAIKDKT